MQKRAENECFGNIIEFSLLDWSDLYILIDKNNIQVLMIIKMLGRSLIYV